MPHDSEPIQPLPSKATLTDVVAKLNEVIECMNHMWFPHDHEEEEHD